MKTKKKVIRLTESDLHNMVTETVKNALNEAGFWNNMLGAAKGAYAGYRANQQANRTENSNNTSNRTKQLSTLIMQFYHKVGDMVKMYNSSNDRDDIKNYIQECKIYIDEIEKALKDPMYKAFS